MASRPSFSNLPQCVVEEVLGYLTFREVTVLRGLCRSLRETCGRIVRIGVRRLKSDIFRQLGLLRRELLRAVDPDGVLLRLPLFRCYNVLEVLKAELDMLCVLGRSVLTKEGDCFPGGHLLDEYRLLVNKVISRDIPCWSLENDVTTHLVTLSKKFLEGFLNANEDRFPQIGILIVDILDILIEVNYNLTVTYDLKQYTCRLVGEYELRDAKFLALPPDIPAFLEGRSINRTESKDVITFLTQIVRFNNRMLLREEQYWREMQGTRMQQQGTSELSPRTRLPDLSRLPREYSRSRMCNTRNVLSEGVIRETYCELGSGKCALKGFWCSVKLTCSIDDAPYEVLDGFQRLKLKVVAGKVVEFNRSKFEVKIRDFLELPSVNLDLLTTYTNVDTEQEVEVHFPMSQPTLVLENSEEQFTPHRLTSVEYRSFKSVLLDVPEQYGILAEFRIGLPIRGSEVEIYTLSIRDGDQGDEETELMATSQRELETEKLVCEATLQN